MNSEVFIHYTAQAMQLVLYLSMPTIIAATLVGLLIGLFQALTSIQEQTLPHGFKLLATVVTLVATARWMGPQLYLYTTTLFDQIATVGR